MQELISKFFLTYKYFIFMHVQFVCTIPYCLLQVPIYVATYILSSAKKILISFMYDFLLRYIPFHKVNLLLTDTDSCYAAFSEESLEACVKPELRREFDDRLQNHCSAKGKTRHPEAFLPRTCCSECNLVDCKYPGLWKVS